MKEDNNTVNFIYQYLFSLSSIYFIRRFFSLNVSGLTWKVSHSVTLSISFTGNLHDISQSLFNIELFIHFPGTSDGLTGTSVVSAMTKTKVSF